MVWLANFNAGPISFQYGSDGRPVPVASSISLAGHTWNLYSGSNGANNVFSFLPTSGTITSFSGDLKPFFNVSLLPRRVMTADDVLTGGCCGGGDTVLDATPGRVLVSVPYHCAGGHRADLW